MKTIQQVYTECYGLTYNPTVMVPASLNGFKDIVYYPLQCPFANITTFKSNKSHSTLTELENLRNILLAYQDTFIEGTNDAYDSLLYQASKDLEFSFYHYQANEQHTIGKPAELLERDKRFTFSYIQHGMDFSVNAKLFRGCVQISK